MRFFPNSFKRGEQRLRNIIYASWGVCASISPKLSRFVDEWNLNLQHDNEPPHKAITVQEILVKNARNVFNLTYLIYLRHDIFLIQKLKKLLYFESPEFIKEMKVLETVYWETTIKWLHPNFLAILFCANGISYCQTHVRNREITVKWLHPSFLVNFFFHQVKPNWLEARMTPPWRLYFL